MFCPLCFNEKAEPILIEYQDILERAKSVDVFDKDQGTETRLIKRTEKPLRIVDCSDRKETLMRLAFIAAQKGFDTLVDTNITSRKVTNGRYKKLVWSGTAVPVTKKEKQRPQGTA